MTKIEHSLDEKDIEFFNSAFQKYIDDGGNLEKLQNLIDSTDFIPNTLEKLNSTISWDHFNSILDKKDANLQIIHKGLKEYGEQRNSLWKEPFELFETMIYVSKEISDEIYSQKIDNKDQKEEDLVLSSIFQLHCLACRIAQEIIILMQAGFPDGAIARWRTLHEVVVISYFIRKNGHEIAYKFLLHDAIESYNSIEKYIRKPELFEKHQRALNGLLPPLEELTNIKKIKEMLCEKFDPEFENTYGWAANIIPDPKNIQEFLKNPNFSNIEENVGLDHLRPYYKMANISVHAGSKGIKFSLTSSKNYSLCSGPAILGMADPGQLSAISLFQINVILLSTSPSIRHQADSSALKMLLEKIKKSFIEVHFFTID